MNIFRPLVCYYRVGFVIYLYATFINVTNVPRCVREVIFGRYFPQQLKKCSNNIPVHSVTSS